ncbi:MAG: hypothetical protein JWN67_626 [Actinomycetia bacterium]|jgi:hypothetical protein|nr:hypothetical protein [Actinomycetes bacterium]
MAEDEGRVVALEQWCAELDEEVARLRQVLVAVGIVAAQAERRTQDE